MNRDMLSTSLCREESVDAVSPESGISSASPRSWQSPHHLDLDQSQASPSLQQPGSYPRTAKPQVNLYDALLGLKCIGLNYNHY